MSDEILRRELRSLNEMIDSLMDEVMDLKFKRDEIKKELREMKE